MKTTCFLCEQEIKTPAKIVRMSGCNFHKKCMDEYIIKISRNNAVTAAAYSKHSRCVIL